MEESVNPRTLARPSRRVAFTAWAGVLVGVFGVGLFGLTTLVIAWFQPLEGVAGPVTEVGYGAIILTLLCPTDAHPFPGRPHP